jgi:hypothetical protein
VKGYEIVLMAFDMEKINLYKEVSFQNGDNPSNRANQVSMFGTHQNIQVPFLSRPKSLSKPKVTKPQWILRYVTKARRPISPAWHPWISDR